MRLWLPSAHPAIATHPGGLSRARAGAHAKLLASRGVLAEGAASGDGDGGSNAPPSASMTAEAIRFGLADILDGGGDGSAVGSASGGTEGGTSRADDAVAARGSATAGEVVGPSDSQLKALLNPTQTHHGSGSGSGGGSGSSSGGGIGSGSSGASGSAVAADSIYIFDGIDFARQAGPIARRRTDDEHALQTLLAAQPTGAASGAAAAGGDGGADVGVTGRGRRLGGAMGAEEAAAERARQAEAVAAAEVAKKMRADERKRERWRKAGYVSLALADPATLPPVPAPTAAPRGGGGGGGGSSRGAAGGGGSSSDRFMADDSPDATDEDEPAEGAVGGHDADAMRGDAAAAARVAEAVEEEHADNDGDSDDEADAAMPMRFAVGDAMSASGARGGASGLSERIIVVFTDASGRWPSRGFFRSVSAASGAPQEAYEAAHAHSDLALGDAHLVRCPDGSGGQSVGVCLLVVFKRDKRAPYGTPPELCTSALDAALAKLGGWAERARGASVHSPRLASNGGGAAWYTVERQLRKHLRRVPTTVYYYKRS